MDKLVLQQETACNLCVINYWRNNNNVKRGILCLDYDQNLAAYFRGKCWFAHILPFGLDNIIPFYIGKSKLPLGNIK